MLRAAYLTQMLHKERRTPRIRLKEGKRLKHAVGPAGDAASVPTVCTRSPFTAKSTFPPFIT